MEEERLEQISENKSSAVAMMGERIDDIKKASQSSTTENFSKAVVAMEGATRHRLPEIKIPTFNGEDVLKFPHFWRQYLSIVDDRKDINGTAKMSYLKDCLKGPAFECISTLTADEGGYEAAKKKLVTRYGLKGNK